MEEVKHLKRANKRPPKAPTEEQLEKIADRAVDRVLRKIDPGKMTNINGPRITSIEAQNTATRDEIRQLMNESLYWYYMEPVRTDDETAERLNLFFRHVQETGEIATVEKLCLCLGITPKQLIRWRGGEVGVVRRQMCEKAVSIIAAMDSSLVTARKIPEVTYIFRSKNYYGMSDKQEIEISADTPYEEESPEQLRERYLKSIASANVTPSSAEEEIDS